MIVTLFLNLLTAKEQRKQSRNLVNAAGLQLSKVQLRREWNFVKQTFFQGLSMILCQFAYYVVAPVISDESPILLFFVSTLWAFRHAAEGGIILASNQELRSVYKKNPTMPVFTKKFKMTHPINDIAEIELGQEYGGKEVHFGVLWQLKVYRVGNSICLFMYCLESSDSEWAIDTEIKFGVISGNDTSLFLKCRRTFKKKGENGYSQWGSNNIIDLDMLQYFAVDKKVEFIYEVNILKMTGFENEKLTMRKFDESVEEFSDVVLIVEGMKFYQSKMFLSLQSSYFKSLLLGGFKEAKQAEITLNDINSEDFHSLLELIHGESSVRDTNIDGILHLADMYDIPTAIRRCEQFLLKESKWETAEKLELAITYNLENLKNECMSSSEVPEETKSVQVSTTGTKSTKRVGCFACFQK